jgi:signal recognition particle receptor subunit beta
VSTVNAATREIQAKIVYYGPGLSGKTTTLKTIHDQVRGEHRGQMVSLSTEGDRTLFFDFLPLTVEQVRGLSLRLQLYTVPGQVFYEATRKLVLNGADGVVFVADSQAAAMDANAESLASLERNLVELGHDAASFPRVIQWNKRDIPGVLPVEALRRELNRGGVPDFETVASTGAGVMEALKEITRLVVVALKGRQPARRPEAPAAAAASPGSPLERRISAMAEGRPALTPEPQPTVPPRPAPPAGRPTPMPGGRGYSFARLFPGREALVAPVEQALRDGAWTPAVRAAARALSDLLGSLEVAEPSDAARLALLGLDGRDYLRLLRASRLPEGMASEADALVGLHLLVSARLRSDGL